MYFLAKLPVAHIKNRSIMQLLRYLIGQSTSAEVVREPLRTSDWEKCETLLHDIASEKGGEAKSRESLVRLLDLYRHSTEEDRKQFMSVLNYSLGVDDESVRSSIEVYLSASDDRSKSLSASKLLKSLESPRFRILRQFNLLQNGVQELVNIRSELLRLDQGGDLADLDQDMLRLFTNWFDSGFLELKRIGWDSSASLLEKLIRYEAVHEITSWGDLRNRVDSDRRCYAFFHARMPDEPLIFVEVALVQGIAENVQELLDENLPTLDPYAADTAIFYSISNAQDGLRGVSMGEFLIKRVVEQLLHEFPKLQNFSTLSPVPGFSRWLNERLELSDSLPVTLVDLLSDKDLDFSTAVRDQICLAGGDNQNSIGPLKEWLKCEMAHFLTREKKNGKPVDPVARFHFSNGASLGKINWFADNSKTALRQSYGMMVNYFYKLDEIDANCQAYAEGGELPVSIEVQGLALRSPLRRGDTNVKKLQGRSGFENR